MLMPRPIVSLLENSLAWVNRVNRRLGRLPERTPAHQRGLDGERAACFYLRRQGYTVVARRWRHALLDGEVDLIAWDGETLVFIEVKTRGGRTPFAAEFSVDEGKEEALRDMADAYVRQLPWAASQIPGVSVRFDVVSVYVQDDGDADIRLMRDFIR